MTRAVLAFTAPNRIYNINRYNNYIHIFFGNLNIEVKVYLPFGNSKIRCVCAQDEQRTVCDQFLEVLEGN